MFDPLAGSPWSMPQTVQGFARSQPNDTLMMFAAREYARSSSHRLVDIGCGAGRNAVPLAAAGWHVIGADLSWPMLEAAAARASTEGAADRLQLVAAPMDCLPVVDGSTDMIVAHGIWNLAASAAEFRGALAEAARIAAPGAALFVVTFSRAMLPPDLAPLAGEPYAYSEFSGQPQTFLRRDELVAELDAVGFTLDDGVSFTEHNSPRPGTVHADRTPVLLEATFRRNRA